MKNILKLIFSIAVCELAGVIGSVFTVPAIRSGWYAALAKPEIVPPNWIFGPVWTILYALMGVAAFLVWKNGFAKKGVKIALVIFDTQLVLNIFWSIIFFGLRNPGWAFVEIIFLWLAILAAIVLFAKVSRLATYLLIPYIIWVSFAGYLNYSILMLNQTQPTIAVNLYYYNEELDRDAAGNIACSRNGLAPVMREIPITQTPIQDTVKLLLLGEIGEEERGRGIDTEYPLEEFFLKGASLKDEVLTLEFEDSKNKTVGGACRVGILWFQVEATAKQFPGVREVRFLPEYIFQP